MFSKIKMLSFIILSISFIGITSCSKDKIISLDTAVGTYKGELVVYYAAGSNDRYENATVTVTKPSEGKLTVTPAASTKATPKTFNVISEEGDLFHADETNGSFIFEVETNYLDIYSKKTSATENRFLFRGLKQ